MSHPLPGDADTCLFATLCGAVMLVHVSFRELNSEHRTEHLTRYRHIQDENSGLLTFA